MFALLPSRSRKAKSKSGSGVVAYGGRYDSLLEHFKQPGVEGTRREVYGVGVLLGVE
jgi:translation initiation factor 2-alpha kinase 4